MSMAAIIALVTIGVLLILSEVFLPGGIVGTVGVIFLATGIVGGFFVSPLFGLWLTIGSLVFGILAFWIWMKLFPKSPWGKRIILSGDAAGWDGFDPSQAELLGKEGTSRTPLHPGGIAMIEGRRVDVVTRGEMIPANQQIRVLQVEGNRVVVKAATTPEQTPD